MSNIVPWWYYQNNIHEKISSDDGVLDIGYLNAIESYPYTQNREPEYYDRNPENKKRKNPWSFDDHEPLVSLSYESIDELRLSSYTERLEEPRINHMKWYHMNIVYISL